MSTQDAKIDPAEFALMRDYIEKICGIHITPEKAYLLETRLTVLMSESGYSSFRELRLRASADATNTLRDKIVDMMTTNETLWFRDQLPFTIILESILKKMEGEITAGKRKRINIWSAACSSGQEPYSIAMLVLEYMRKQRTVLADHVSIMATDISPSALFLARGGRYDQVAISRGLAEDLRDRYFQRTGNTWSLKDVVKNMVAFKRLNLQDDFTHLGRQDIILCRNVLIYFADIFKKELLGRFAQLLQPDGILITGASESVASYSNQYEMVRQGQAISYKVRKDGRKGPSS
jgi:chemotaxis protein methyltransferase CheR